jgi:hypothetical protein
VVAFAVGCKLNISGWIGVRALCFASIERVSVLSHMLWMGAAISALCLCIYGDHLAECVYDPSFHDCIDIIDGVKKAL